MFRNIGIRFPPGPSAVTEVIEHGADILVAGDPPVGFAALTRVDGNPHLAQISVLASQAGRGTGSALLAEALRRGGPGMTLVTFRDVPWNGPWYSKHGFHRAARGPVGAAAAGGMAGRDRRGTA
jgi:GNAT superfamily N-acetyltransferase